MKTEGLFVRLLLVMGLTWGCPEQEKRRVKDCRKTFMKEVGKFRNLDRQCQAVQNYVEDCVKPAIASCPDLREKVLSFKRDLVDIIRAKCGPGSLDIPFPTTRTEVATSPMVTSHKRKSLCEDMTTSHCTHGFTEQIRSLLADVPPLPLVLLENIRESCRFVKAHGDNMTQCLYNLHGNCPGTNNTRNTERVLQKYLVLCQEVNVCSKLDSHFKNILASIEREPDGRQQNMTIPNVVRCAERSLQFCPNLRKHFRLGPHQFTEDTSGQHSRNIVALVAAMVITMVF